MQFLHVGLPLLAALLLNSPAHAADHPLSLPIQIAHAQAFDPSPFPDGKQLVYISVVSGEEQLFVMNQNGDNVRVVVNSEGRGTAPRWSSDGKAIYFTNCLAKDCGSDCSTLPARPNP